jgi:RNA polymerase sigma-70 factor (ECF subfamily)
MEACHPKPSAEELLRHASFIRSLAHGLLRDPHDVDDVVQETVVAALQSSPRRLREWMAAVAGNLARRSLRSGRRRAERERKAARREAVPSTAELVGSLELQRQVVEAVLALGEPYRSTIILRFFYDWPPRRIARRQGVPVETVRTRLTRALDQLRARLDEGFGGDRRAWSLGLVALVSFTRASSAQAAATAATGSAIALTGAVMSSKTAVLSAFLVIASFFAGWAVKPSGTSEAEATRTDHRGRTVPYDEYQELRGQLDLANAGRDLMRRELDEIQREFGEKSATAGDAPDGAEKKIEGPRFVYGGMVEALNGLDWDVIGNSMSRMPPVLARLTQALAEGKTLEDLADEIGLVQELTGPLLAEALKMSKSGIQGTGINGIFTHPSVMANAVHAALTKGGMPLTGEQEKLVYEIGLRYTEEDRRRLAGYDEGALGMEKLVGEADLRDRFFAEVHETLSSGQLELICPERVRGLTNSDLFSTGLLYAPLVRPLPFRDRESLESIVVERAMSDLTLDEASKTVVQDAVRLWADTLPEGFLDVPLPRVGPLPSHKADHVRVAAQSQALLMRDLATRLNLSEAQLKSLQAEVGVLVPYLAGSR